MAQGIDHCRQWDLFGPDRDAEQAHHCQQDDAADQAEDKGGPPGAAPRTRGGGGLQIRLGGSDCTGRGHWTFQILLGKANL
ncbi:hypothetical protein GCM10009804_02170 [Kribbella hippodromi]|uniref:Uncharacterized protein n=1 Tax=Kribbella hippodromi TaxID=434347 RepID=A0ABP4MUG3_9ACTN